MANKSKDQMSFNLETDNKKQILTSGNQHSNIISFIDPKIKIQREQAYKRLKKNGIFAISCEANEH